MRLVMAAKASPHHAIFYSLRAACLVHIDLTLIGTVLPANLIKTSVNILSTTYSIFMCFSMAIPLLSLSNNYDVILVNLITGTVEVYDIIAKLTDYTLILLNNFIKSQL